MFTKRKSLDTTITNIKLLIFSWHVKGNFMLASSVEKLEVIDFSVCKKNAFFAKS